MTYLVYIGNPAYESLRVTGLSWWAARDLLAARLRVFATDDCVYCKGDAATELMRLFSMEPGAFAGEVNGDDYMIIPENEGTRHDSM